MNFASEFYDLMPHLITVTPVTTDARGDVVSSGSPIAIPCVIEGYVRTLQRPGGKEVVTRVQVITDRVSGLTTTSHRYALPPAFPPPSENLEAVSVEIVSDEDGPDHEIVII